MIKSKKLLLYGAAALLGCSVSQSSFAKKKLPNIIYILTDDLGYGDVSCLNPESKIQTPNIDKLAKSGVTFTDAHSSSAVCTPSRYSVLTGRYAWRTHLKRGVLTGFSAPLIKKERTTVASHLKKQGYNTACIGKWHLGMDWATKDGKKPQKFGENVDFNKAIKNGPVSRGFDYYYGISASLDMSPYVFIENDKVTQAPDTYLKGRKQSPYGRGGYAYSKLKPEDFVPAITSKTVSKINEYSKNSDKPFFIYLPLPAPHTPVVPNKEFLGKSNAGKYGDFVVEVDHSLGRIMKALDENGIKDNTLVIFTSDNGPEVIAYKRTEKYNHFSMGELKGLKRDLWEGGHRVPFFASWPDKVRKGKICNKTVCLADFLATVADITDSELKSDEGEDSFSILSLLTKRRGKTKRDFTIHHSARGNFAIRKGDWVLIDHISGNDNRRFDSYYTKKGYTLNTHKGELYNLKKDLKEFKNLYAEKPAKVKELKAILEKCKK